jgi:hypothetical protein
VRSIREQFIARLTDPEAIGDEAKTRRDGEQKENELETGHDRSLFIRAARQMDQGPMARRWRIAHDRETI